MLTINRTPIIYDTAHYKIRREPIRPFVLSTRHHPSPNALRASGLVDVAHRDRGSLGLPAGQ